jgi:hypothetical protein
MNRTTKTAAAMTIAAACAALTGGCATHQSPFVSQADLDAWRDVPVAALDRHSLFLTVPMIRTVAPDGLEIRNYSNKVYASRCGGSTFGTASAGRAGSNTVAYGQFTQMQSCTAGMTGCDNLFYIRDGKVLEYKAVGRCYTNEKVRPEPGWQRLN